MSFAIRLRFWAIAANVNSSWAPRGPRSRRRPSRRMRLRCANLISMRLRSCRERSKASSGMRPGNVARAFVDASGDPSKRRLGTASGLEMALGALDNAAAIEDRVPVIDPAHHRQPLPRWASIRVSELVVAKVLAREGAIATFESIMDWHVRHDLLLYNQFSMGAVP